MMRRSILFVVPGLGLSAFAVLPAALGAEPSGVSAKVARQIETRLVDRQSKRLFEIPAAVAQQELSSDATGVEQEARDKDRDGLTDAEEALVGTDRLLADTDGDALLDGWEVKGVNGIDLRSLGASPLHKDIFVEMDYMRKPGDLDALRPTPAALARIRAVFAGAAVANPDGAPGIELHLIEGQEVPYDDDLDLAAGEFDTLKAANFDPLRAPVFHYMIWANGHNGGDSSGNAMTIPSSHFIVTLGKWAVPGGTEDQKVGTFIHELGHDLGLRHGSMDDVNHKPNHLSVMNYSFQTVGIPTTAGPRFDFQSLRLGPLRETALTESFGIGTAPELGSYSTIFWNAAASKFIETRAGAGIDWDQDGTVGARVAADLNGDGARGVLGSGSSEWTRLVFAGGSIGKRQPIQTLFSVAKHWAPPAPPDELTQDQERLIRQRLVR